MRLMRSACIGFLIAVLVLSSGAQIHAGRGESGFAQLSIIDRNDAPVAGVTVRIVQRGCVVYSSTTGQAGVVQWSNRKVPEGRYTVTITKGYYHIRTSLNMRYREVGWVTFTHRIN